MRKYLFIFFFLLFAGACENPVSDKGLLEEITASEKGLIRGIDLGMSAQKVKEIEAKGLTEADVDYLFYEFLIDSLNSYTFAYSFENDSLTEIKADIYLISAEKADILVKSFQEYYTKKYEEPINEQGTLWIWTTKYNDENIKIELGDESADYNSGKLSITIYKNTESNI